MYTLAITSCGRHDLLERTLVSFYSTVDELPYETIIYEDGPTPKPKWLSDSWVVKWIQGGERIGQLAAADALYQHIKTPEVFHCEDDWLFTKPAEYIRRSRKILESHRQVIMVSLRGRTGWHPLVKDPLYPFPIAQPDWNGWGGFAFNPGLRRLADWQRIGGYSLHATHSAGAEHERQLSMMYHKMGYIIADLGEEIVRHLGEGRSILDEFTRARGSRDVPAS